MSGHFTIRGGTNKCVIPEGFILFLYIYFQIHDNKMQKILTLLIPTWHYP